MPSRRSRPSRRSAPSRRAPSTSPAHPGWQPAPVPPPDRSNLPKLHRASRDAQGVRRGARGARRGARGRRGARCRSQQLDARRGLQEDARRSLLRDVHRGAAHGRGRGRDAGGGLRPVRLDVRGLPHARVRLHPDGRDLARQHPPLRFARRRFHRRGRSVADGTRGPRDDARGSRQHGPVPLRRESDREARRSHGRPSRHLVHPDHA